MQSVLRHMRRLQESAACAVHASFFQRTAVPSQRCQLKAEVLIETFTVVVTRTVACVETAGRTLQAAARVRAGTSTTPCATRATSSATRGCRARSAERPTDTSRRRKWCSAPSARSEFIQLSSGCASRGPAGKIVVWGTWNVSCLCCRHVHADCDDSIDPSMFDVKKGAPDPLANYQCPVCKNREVSVALTLFCLSTRSTCYSLIISV